MPVILLVNQRRVMDFLMKRPHGYGSVFKVLEFFADNGKGIRSAMFEFFSY